MSEELRPFGLSELIPGIKEVLRTWSEMKNKQHDIEKLAQLSLRLESVQHKNLKHLRWVRILIGVSIIELLAFVAYALFQC